jgi:sterol desaturase/sphingolipid hydroxylase (fatty acid hydroxylase superfamily)
MLRSIVSVIVGLFLLFAVFGIIERIARGARPMPVLRRGFWTDLGYALLTPLTSKAAGWLSVLLILLPVVLAFNGRLEPSAVMAGFGPLSHLPLWLQACLILVVTDFAGYWTHRWMHTPGPWRIHAVHHSSLDLDWLSAVRVHPLNDVINRVAGALPVLAIGAAPAALAGVTPLLTLFAIFLHANVDWDWGPMRTVLASPRFHRWHHTCEAEGLDRNFAGLLPLWDRLFGTYFMPAGRRPEAFGADLPVPAGLLGQLAFPFRRPHRTAITAAIKAGQP